MKITIVSESPADEEAIRILLDGIRGTPFEVMPLIRRRPQGWTDVVKSMPAVVKEVFFNFEAEALAVVIDSDLSPVHAPEHEGLGAPFAKCRYCELKATIERTVAILPP